MASALTGVTRYTGTHKDLAGKVGTTDWAEYLEIGPLAMYAVGTQDPPVTVVLKASCGRRTTCVSIVGQDQQHAVLYHRGDLPRRVVCVDPTHCASLQYRIVSFALSHRVDSLPRGVYDIPTFRVDGEYRILNAALAHRVYFPLCITRIASAFPTCFRLLAVSAALYQRADPPPEGHARRP